MTYYGDYNNNRRRTGTYRGWGKGNWDAPWEETAWSDAWMNPWEDDVKSELKPVLDLPPGDGVQLTDVFSPAHLPLLMKKLRDIISIQLELNVPQLDQLLSSFELMAGLMRLNGEITSVAVADDGVGLSVSEFKGGDCLLELSLNGKIWMQSFIVTDESVTTENVVADDSKETEQRIDEATINTVAVEIKSEETIVTELPPHKRYEKGKPVVFLHNNKLAIYSPNYNEAWNKAEEYLIPGIGETWYWQHFKQINGRYKLTTEYHGFNYSSNSGWHNRLNLTEDELPDVLKKLVYISKDQTNYNAVLKLKTDRRQSDALVALVQSAQLVLKLKPTGVYDKVTKGLTEAKYIQDKQREQEKQLNSAVTTTSPVAVPAKSTEMSTGEKIIVGAIQAWIDIQPTTWLFRYLLSEYDKIAPAERERRIRIVYADKISELKKDQYEPPTWTWFFPMIRQSWRVICNARIGYYQYMLDQPENSLVLQQSIRNAISMTLDPAYYMGLMGGILPGIGKWFVDLKDMVVMLIELPGMVIDLISKIDDAATSAANWLTENAEGVVQFFAALIHDEEFRASLTAKLSDALAEGAKGIGASLAKAELDFLLQTPYDQGKAIGTLIGYIIPEIIIAVFSEGIGNAVKGAVKAVQIIVEAIKLTRVGKLIGTALLTVRKMFKVLESLFDGLKKIGRKGYEKIEEMFRKFLNGLKKFFGITDDMPVTVADDVPVTAGSDDLARQVGDEGGAVRTDNTAKLDDANKKADDTVDRNDNDRIDKVKALAEAILKTEIADAANLPISELMFSLRITQSKYKGVKGFEFDKIIDAPGNFSIWMLGSRYLVNGRYTMFGPEEARIISRSNNGFHLLEGSPATPNAASTGWQHILERHIIGSPGSGKSMFPKNMSRKQIQEMIIEASENGIFRRNPGNLTEVIHTFKPQKYGVSEVLLWIDETTMTIANAYPIKGSAVWII